LVVNHIAGGIENRADAIVFHDLTVKTPTSAFVLAGEIRRRTGAPSVLDLGVHADQFAFQEWSGVLHGLRNIAVRARFETTLKGPLAALATDLRLESTAGSIEGAFVLDTKVQGWHGKGAVNIGRLNLAGWLNRPD